MKPDRTLLLVAAALLLAGPVRAQLSDAYRAWGEGPVSFLFTDADRAAWQEIQTDEEAKRFQQLFWARRDPDPATPENETWIEFEKRVAAADQRFGDDDHRGAMTDQGRVLILLGVPTRMSRQGGSAFGTEAGGGGDGRSSIGGGATNFDESVEDIWIYERERLPAGVKTNRLTFRFVTERGYGVAVMNRQGQVLNALAAGVAALVTRPELTYADLPSLSAGTAGAASAWKATSLADEKLVAALSGDPRALTPKLAADLDAAAFQASDGSWEVVAQVMSRTRQSGQSQLVGLVRDAEGAQTLAFSHAQDWRDSHGRSYVHQSLALPPGTYDLRLGLADPGGELAWLGSRSVTVPATDDFWLSDVVVSDEVRPLKEAQDVREPWAWEGVAVVPKGGGLFAPGAEMWLYLHACNVQPGADGEPALRVNLVIEGPRRLRGPIRIEPSRAGVNCYVLATGIDLVADKFPPGDYDVAVRVSDTVAGKAAESRGAFKIEGASQ